MGKRMLSLCMALALCLGLLPATALAADTEIGDWEIALPEEPELTDTWLGSNEDGEPYYDISWYKASKTEFVLESAAELAGLAALLLNFDWSEADASLAGRPDKLPDNVNFNSVTIKLGDNIDLSAHSWVPIETFSGTFDGNGKRISNLRVTIGVTSYAGLFSYGSPTVKDVTLDNVYIVSDESSAGGIIGDARSNANIEDCKVSGTIIYTGNSGAKYSVGGIAGEIGSEVSVSDCTFSGTVYSENNLNQNNGVGGIVGSTSASSSTIKDCMTDEDAIVCAEATDINAGGIVGYVTDGSVKNCTNNGEIKTKTESAAHGVGGIVGEMTASSDYGIQTCTNTGEITAAGDTTGGNIGGILGLQYSGQGFSITDCHNSGEISLSGSKQCQVGGIAGGGINGTTIERCSNTGAITVTASREHGSAGGIAGKTTGGTVKISQCYNAAAVSIEKDSAGGLVGTAMNYADTQISNCYNVGAVSGRNAAGAIGWLRLDMNGEHKLTLEGVFNAGTIAGTSQGGLLGYQTTAGQVTNTLTNCSYWGNCGATGEGNALTANQMTDDTAWATNLGLNSSTWEKENNPITVDSDGNWMGNLPVLSANKQAPAPQIQRTQKQDQPRFAITGEPTDTIYIDSTGFQLGTTGGAEGLSVTWSSSDDDVATVDDSGQVAIKGVGQVTITAKKAGNDSYNEASDAYTFTVYGHPITKVTILDLAAPVQGESPRQNVSVPENDPYEALTSAGIGGHSTLQVTWREHGSGNVITTAFEQDKVYTVTMALKCDDYYSFADNVKVNLSNMLESAYETITAKKDTVHGYENKLIITVTFKPTSHVHNWATAWSSNATHHWYACTAEDCLLKNPNGMDGYAQHTDTDNNGICDTCYATIGYLITFNPNGGVCEIQNTRTDVNGALSSLPTPTRSGYTFLGWYTEDGTQVGEDTVFTQDTTLTAQWQYNAPPANPNYKITIEDTEHGTVTTPTSAKQGTEVTLTPTPEEGYEVGEVTVTDRFGEAVEVTENADGTYTFTMPNGQVTVEVTFVESQPEPLPFTDVAESDWFYDAVRYAYENGLMGGIGDNLFAPNHPTTRAQLVTILYRLEGEPAVTGQSPFTDVEADTWYTDAVTWAAEEGVVNGVSATQFAPGNNITREQLATILFRYAQAKGYDVSPRADLSGFPDAGDILPYAQEAMAWAVAEGLLQGFEDDTLRPQGNATRAQIATILMRFCEGVVE